MKTHGETHHIPLQNNFSADLNAFFKFIVDDSRDGWSFRDNQGAIQYTNKAFSKWLGVSRRTLMSGTKLEQLHISFNQNKSRIFKLETEVKVKRQEGSIILPVISPSTLQRSLCRINLRYFQDGASKIEGVLWHCAEYEMVIMYPGKYESVKLTDADLKIKSPYDVCTLREWDLIWPLIMGYRREEVAKNLNVTPRHLGKVLTVVMEKFCAEDFNALLSKTLQLKLHKFIPATVSYIQER